MGYKILPIISILIMLFFMPQCLQAGDVFDLSYILTEGGFKLELNPVNQYRGVKIRVDSNINTRYEVTQRIIKPLENRDDPRLVIRDNFTLRGLRGTNRYGTLRLSSADTPVKMNEILYVSGASGEADSFTAVYGLNRIEEIEPGEYFGRISFTLSPIGAVSSAVTKILEVRVSISEKAQIKPRIEIATVSGSRHISLNSKRESAKTVDVLVKINGRFRNQFTILQQVSTPLESALGDRLDYKAAQFVVRDVTKGAAVNQITPLSSRPQSLYTSAPNGEADEQFIITYSLADLSGQTAGKYRSQIQYLLEEKGAQTKIVTLQLEIENERIFDLTVTPQGQKYTIEFRDLKPLESPKKDEVLIEINTNIAKPYQVTQNIHSDLINKEGKNIPSQYFTFRTESVDIKGKLKFTDRTEVKQGETVLFSSDEQGLPDKFKIIYELSCPLESKAGDYSTRVTYSLLEM